jgi:hypothetical protein
MARWFELAEMSDSKLEKPYYLAEKLCWEVKWVNLWYRLQI